MLIRIGSHWINPDLVTSVDSETWGTTNQNYRSFVTMSSGEKIPIDDDVGNVDDIVEILNKNCSIRSTEGIIKAIYQVYEWS